MRSYLGSVGVAALLGLATLATAGAQTTVAVTNGVPVVGLPVPGLGNAVTYTDNGWSFTLKACTVTGGAGACATDEMFVTATATSLSLVFEGSGGGNLESLAAGSTTPEDLTLNVLSVTAPGSEVIWSVGSNVSGSATGSDKSLVTVSSGAIVSGATQSSQQAMSSLATSGTLQSIVFTPATSVSNLADLKTNNTPSGPITMASATLVYNAPEPVSLSLLAVGAVGVGLVRRKSRRVA